MTDAKPVAELRREAHDACGLMLKAFKETGGDPMETIPLHIIIDALANRAEAAEARPSVEICQEERAQGNGGCGACALCCKEWREKTEAAERERDEACRELGRLRQELDMLKGVPK